MASAERLLGQLRCLLAEALAEPERRVSQLSLASASEVERLAGAWRAPLPEACEETLPARFREAAAQAGDRVALRDGKRSASFRELDAWSERFAAHLVETGLVPPGSVVAVEHEPGIDHVVAALAVLKAGAAVLALDPADPPLRRRVLLEASAARLVVSSPGRSEAAAAQAYRLGLDLETLAAEPGPSGQALDRARSDNLAWVSFTSGSEGRPRPVALEHRSILGRLAWSWSTLPFAEDEVCCWKTPLGFVDTIGELYTPLLAGVTCLTIPESVAATPPPSSPRWPRRGCRASARALAPAGAAHGGSGPRHAAAVAAALDLERRQPGPRSAPSLLRAASGAAALRRLRVYRGLGQLERRGPSRGRLA